VWQLIEARPAHLLDPAFATWDEAILWAIDDTIRTLTADGTPLAARTWGEANRAAIRHPLAMLPLLGRFLSMPAEPQAGDAYTPRAHVPSGGPSERMAVSPGREAEGILHIPVGQSAHPLSAYFRSQHEAWMKGEALPFLPGQAEHTLVLTP
jgi:penicillin amidase